jgi:hypothetical protein
MRLRSRPLVNSIQAEDPKQHYQNQTIAGGVESELDQTVNRDAHNSQHCSQSSALLKSS